MKIRITLLLATALFASKQTAAQAPTKTGTPPPRIRLNENESLLEMRWGFDAKHGFMVHPNPMYGGSETHLTPHSEDPSFKSFLASHFQNIGVLGYVTLLLFGDEDLASHAFADYHFRRIGLDRSNRGIRTRIATRPEGESDYDRRVASLHRLLAVRIAQRRGLRAATDELRAVARDGTEEALLRWAAEDALATLSQTPLSAEKRAARAPSTAETLAAIPGQYDVILSMNHADIPFHRQLPWFARRLGLGVIIQDLNAHESNASQEQLAGGQLLADTMSLLCFESARACGNFRIARVTGTVYAARGQDLPYSWIRADGKFDAARLRHQVGLITGAKLEGDTLSTPSWRVRITDRFVEFHSADYPLKNRGTQTDKLREQGFSTRDLFLHLRRTQRLTVMTGVPINQLDGARVLGRQTDQGDLELAFHCKNSAQARGLASLWRSSLPQVKEEMQRELEHVTAEQMEKMMVTLEHEDDSEVLISRWPLGWLNYSGMVKFSINENGAVSKQDGPPPRDKKR